MDTLQKQGAYIQGSNKARETLFTTDFFQFFGPEVKLCSAQSFHSGYRQTF